MSLTSLALPTPVVDVDRSDAGEEEEQGCGDEERDHDHGETALLLLCVGLLDVIVVAVSVGRLIDVGGSVSSIGHGVPSIGGLVARERFLVSCGRSGGRPVVGVVSGVMVTSDTVREGEAPGPQGEDGEGVTVLSHVGCVCVYVLFVCVYIYLKVSQCMSLFGSYLRLLSYGGQCR